MSNYIVASTQNWYNVNSKSKEYDELKIIEVRTKDDLNLELLEKINPRYVFFPHWHWKVESEITERYECVAFHTAPLPFGRGGSPIQNLILRNIETSPVCALRMTEILDGGPIYDSIEVTLDGTITDIFVKISACIEKLIIKICQENIEPQQQSGQVVSFNRLDYTDNELKNEHSIKEIYDRIRMVDGDGYRKAHINFGDYKIDFTDSQIQNNEIVAKIRLYRDGN
jgi:methionyl-tRNA formyltransferase